jgi:hypothetical protein
VHPCGTPAYIHEQWGIFALSFLYAYSWLRGFRIHWWARWRAA